MKKEVFRMENVIGDETELTNLNNMSFNVFSGEIMGLIPVNGCGKAHLLKLLGRNIPIRFGRIYINERLVNSYMYSDGGLNQIYLMNQKSKLIAEFTVLDNIYMLQKVSQKFYYNRIRVRKQFRWLCENVGVDINPEIYAYRLSPLERFIVEIMKGMVQGAKLIVMNGIGESISDLHLKTIKNIMTVLAKQGMSFLYICNNYEEIISVCDRILFMKDGKDLKLFDRSEFDRQWFSEMLTSFPTYPNLQQKEAAPVVLETKNMSVSFVKDISLMVKAGKCIVLYDKNRIFDQVLNYNEITFGEVILNGEMISGSKLKREIGRKIMFLMPSPLETMIYPDLTYLENLCLGLGRKMGKKVISKRVLKSVQEEYKKIIGGCVGNRDVLSADLFDLYKLIYYRIHLLNPLVVVICYPFKNTDINLRKHIVKLILMLKEKGIGIVIISVDINASMLVADELRVIENGHLSKNTPDDSKVKPLGQSI